MEREAHFNDIHDSIITKREATDSDSDNTVGTDTDIRRLTRYRASNKELQVGDVFSLGINTPLCCGYVTVSMTSPTLRDNASSVHIMYRVLTALGQRATVS